MSNGNAPTLQSVYSCEENCRRTYTDWIAVSPETTETGVADLFYTVLFNGIPLDEFIAFGDLDNDIALLEKAGWGVCLLNGSDKTKAVAQAVTEYDVRHDGVGHYLEDHWYCC